MLLITLDGPKSRNSVGPLIYPELQSLMIEAGQDPNTQAVVITGAAGFFSSGGNINALRNSAGGTLSAATANTDGLNAMIKSIVECAVPVIAAVEGGAAGAGASIALSCDMIVASQQAKFTIAHVRVGLCPDGGATYLLRSALPRQMVMEMCLLGQPMPAGRLADAGIINTLMPEGQVLGYAMELAGRIAAGPPHAISIIKNLVNTATGNDLATHLDREGQAINLARFGQESAEGLSAFLEKRSPDFTSARNRAGAAQARGEI